MSTTPAAPTRDREGYYKTPYGRLMSVTTILSNGVPKPALVHWAAREVAQCAVDNLPRLARVRGQAARSQTFDWLRRAAEVKRDTAAKLGGAVHDALEASVLDQPWPEPTEEQEPFLAAFARFVADHDPVWEAAEMTLANPADGWAGRGDWWATLPRLDVAALVIGDTKTGKGVYAEAGLQLSAYQRATHGWLRDGTEVTPPAATRALVLHLRPDAYPDRGYGLIPVDTGEGVYEAFLAAARVAAFVKGDAEHVVGEPIEAPNLAGVA